MTTTCEKWPPFVHAVTGSGRFDSQSDSNIWDTPSEMPEYRDESATKWRIFKLVRHTPGIMKSEVADILGIDLADAVELIREMRIEGYLRRA